MVATYEDVKDMPNQPHKYLIDVRNESELVKTGIIPTSVNIPVSELDTALQLSDDEFKAKYKRDKPKKDTEIIFHCMAGMRAKRAADSAKEQGYANSKYYEGSWNDWAKREGL